MADMCKEMKLHLRMERETPRGSLYENVHTMTALQRQAMQGAQFILKHEAALREAGQDPATDDTLLMLQEELSEVLQQVRMLRLAMKEDQERAKAVSARDAMSGGSRDMDASADEKTDNDKWEEG
jgi:hypothetical protein